MKEKVLVLVLCLCSIILLICCNNRRETSNDNSEQIDTKEPKSYEEMYRDSFDVLIGSLDYAPTYADTLYTEMYIALKTLESDSKSADIVLDRVSKLMVEDTIKENQIHYLDAKSIVLSIQGKEDEFWDNAYEQFNLYPENSYERLISLGALFKKKGNNDSATYYFDKCMVEYQKKLSTRQDDVDMEEIIYAILCSYVLQDKDTEAKLFVKDMSANDFEPEVMELLEYVTNNYNGFKSEVLRTFYF